MHGAGRLRARLFWLMLKDFIPPLFENPDHERARLDPVTNQAFFISISNLVISFINILQQNSHVK